ncbi:MAG: ATP-binding protein [Phenylobacterium sp.]|jgi:two-component system osmolarity sensor histidine kinase EnvZ|nr:ATP-binding protein [Phenylobacterium sp.]
MGRFGPASDAWRRLVKRSLPTTLYGRTFLIIVLPVALMQLAVAWVFFDAHWRTVTMRLSEGLAGDIAWALESYADDPTPAGLARTAGRAERSMSLSIAFQPDRPLPETRRRNALAAVDASLRQALAARIDAPFWFDTTRYPAYVDIRVEVPGGVLRVLAPKERAIASQGLIFLGWMAAATLILTGVSLLFIRNQVRAIERLAQAAEDFGRGRDAPAFKPHGAREVRQAAQAFLAMKARIQRHIEQRTALLASVSHDLRTPLTRLRLELALAEPGPATQAMKQDLIEMEHMIDEYLAFARGEGGEQAVDLDIAALVREAAEGARRTGAKVAVAAPAEVPFRGRRSALKRAFANLIGNAAAHGQEVCVDVEVSVSGITIRVDDDGPGIPPERREEAFRAFNRLDESRNQNTKGVGLGLAIARDAARSHGGDVRLEDSPLGGLRAVLRLPGSGKLT